MPQERQDEYEVWPAHGGGYFWHLKAANNEIVCASQMYSTREAALNGAKWVKANAGAAPIYDYTRKA